MTLHGVEVPWAAVRPGHLYFWEACCRVELARPFIFNSFLFLGVLLGSGPYVGTTKWWFHFRVWRGSWGLWGGSRPAQNVPAKVVLGRGQVKFLPAVTPGLWLKNWGTQAGAAQPRGLCKHGRCSQVGLWGPWGGGASGGQGTGFRVARGQCLQERGIWGRGGRSPNPETWRAERRVVGWEGKETGRDRERLRKREMEKETGRDSQRREADRKPERRSPWSGGGGVASPASRPWGVSALRCPAPSAQRAGGGGPGPGARTGWASVTVSASLCCTSEACW